MFYDKSDSEFPQWREHLDREESRGMSSPYSTDCCDNGGSEGNVESEGKDDADNHSDQPASIPARAAYEREVIASVWECAEIVPGTDPVIWRKDEYGAWIHRADYGRRTSEFGWEIFDPGVGRHSQGVYAMRPMQWRSYISQYSTML